MARAMNLAARFSLGASALLALSSCVGPDGLPFPPPVPPLPPLPGLSASPSPNPPAEQYRPELADEYRSGYDIGSQDRNYGYPQDAGRAYDRFGRGYESVFREGYADGFEGRGMRR